MAGRTLRGYPEQTAATRGVGLTKLLENACQELGEGLGASNASALLLEDARTHLTVAAEYRAPGAPPRLGELLDLPQGPLAAALAGLRQPVLVDDAATDARVEPVRPLLERMGTRSLAVFPLLVEGEVLGALVAHAARPGAFAAPAVQRAALLARDVERELARIRLGKSRRRLEKMPGGTETLLLVDDEAVVRGALCRVLRSCGYRVLEAKNADEALAALEGAGGQVALVVTDVMMPGPSGVALATRVLEGGAPPKVILMSGFGNEEPSEALLSDPCVRFLQKPFNASVLASAVRELLDGAAGRGRE